MDLLVRGLAVYRLSRMLVEEDGPFGVFWNLRRKTGIDYSITGDPVSYPDWHPLVCIYCTSVWVGLALWLLPSWVSRPLALSAIAVLLKDGGDKWL